MNHESKSIGGDVYGIDDVSDILSPGLLIYRDLVEANIAEMIHVAGGPNRLCPHCKTHKTREITKLMLDSGITHHKCATIAEAEMLASVGVKEVLIAYQLVGPNIKRLFALYDSFPGTRFATIVDNSLVAEQLNDEAAQRQIKLPVLVDLETGMGRTGIAPDDDGVELVEQIVSSPGLQLKGLHWYDGHNRQPDLQERRGYVMAGWQRMTEFRNRLLMEGIKVNKVVAAGTGSFPILAQVEEPGLLLSPGTTTFHDSRMTELFPEMNFQPALGILTRVISCNAPDQVTLDVGHKACAADQPAGDRLQFPSCPDAVEIHQTEEHCVIESQRTGKLSIGTPLIAIPKHACPTSAVHAFATVISGGKVVGRWEIAARDRQLTI